MNSFVELLSGSFTGSSGQAGIAAAMPKAARKWVYYTGYTSNATSSSRSAIAEDVTVGSVVCWDNVTGTGTPASADRNDRYPGIDVTRPATALLGQVAGVVTAVPSGSTRGGLIEICTAAFAVQVRCTCTSTGMAVGDNLGPTDGSFIATRATLDATNASTITASLKNLRFDSQATTGAAITDTLHTCRFGGPLGVLGGL